MLKRTIILLLVAILAGSHLSASELLKPEKAAKQKWYQAETSNFTVITDTSEKKAIRLATNLERFRAMFEILNGTKLGENIRPIKLFATKRDKTYRFLHGDREAMRGTGGYFRGSVNGNYSAIKVSPRKSSYNLSILFHEYTHYLSSNISSVNIPYWYSEGLAEFLSKTSFKDDSVIDYGRPIKHHILNIARSSWMPLEELLSSTRIIQKNPEKRYKIYSQGWLFVHYLNSKSVGSAKKKMFLAQLSKTGSPTEAVQIAFDKSIKELNKDLRDYLNSRLYYSRITLGSPLKTDQIETRRLEPYEVVYELGEIALQSLNDFETSRAYFEYALELNPKHADALAGLANSYFGSDLKKSSEYIDQAKSLAPDNPWVATVSGHLNSNLLQTAKTSEEETKYWNKAVRDYNIAINSGGLNVEAIVSAALLYKSKMRWEKYHELSEYAYSIAPNNYATRIQVIDSYLSTDQAEKAEIIADRVRKNHHATADSSEAFEQWYEKRKANPRGEKVSSSD